MCIFFQLRLLNPEFCVYQVDSLPLSKNVSFKNILYVDTCVFVCIHVHGYMCGGQSTTLSIIPQVLSTLDFETGFPTVRSSPDRLLCLATETQDALISIPLALELHCTPLGQAFQCGYWRLKLGLHAFVASSFPSDLFQTIHIYITHTCKNCVYTVFAFEV